MKFALLAALALVSSMALAAPTLTTDPYPSAGVQPDTASVTVNGQPGPACTLAKGTDSSTTPTCDLASLPPLPATATGAYSIVVSVTKKASCTLANGITTCVTGSAASSVPFPLNITSGSVAAPSNPHFAP